MPTLVVRLQPEDLANPDLDIRYALPDLLEETSGGLLLSDGYDYAASDEGKPPALLLFFLSDEGDAARRHILAVLETTQVLGNDLRGAVTVSVEEAAQEEASPPPPEDIRGAARN